MAGSTASGPAGQLTRRSDEICAALLALRHDHLPEPHRSWLREQYRVLVPVVLPAALHAVEHGGPLPTACLERVRELAAGCGPHDVPLGVCLRAGLPAIGVVSVLAQRTSGAAEAVRLVHRAGVVAHEIGSTWVEAWTRARGHDTDDAARGTAPGGDVDTVDRQLVALVARGRSNAEIAAQMHYSRQAVGWRLSRLMQRWSVTNRAALVDAAFRAGVLRAPWR